MTRAWMIVAVLAIAALLGWLRDPPWLAGMTHGLGEWNVDEGGTRARWAAGRSSFFVPAETRTVRFAVRTAFDNPNDWPVVVSVTLDDRAVERVTLDDPTWRVVEIVMPAEGSRRHRRIDLHVNRLRAEARGVLLSEIVIVP